MAVEVYTLFPQSTDKITMVGVLNLKKRLTISRVKMFMRNASEQFILFIYFTFLNQIRY